MAFRTPTLVWAHMGRSSGPITLHLRGSNSGQPYLIMPGPAWHIKLAGLGRHDPLRHRPDIVCCHVRRAGPTIEMIILGPSTALSCRGQNCHWSRVT